MRFKIQAKVGDGIVEGEFEYNLGSSLDEAIGLFGPKTVWEYFTSGAARALRVKWKGLVLKGKTPEEASAIVASSPIDRAVTDRSVERARALLQKLPENERRAIIEEILASRG